MYLLKEENRSAGREKRKEEKKRKEKNEPKGKRQCLPERRQGGGCVRARGKKKNAPQAWRERDGAALCGRGVATGHEGCGRTTWRVSS